MAVNTAYVDTVIDYVSKDIIQYSYDVIDIFVHFYSAYLITNNRYNDMMSFVSSMAEWSYFELIL